MSLELRSRAHYRERFRFTGLRPGAFGLPFRGDDSLACLTNSSTRAFGTAINFRICSVKWANSGVELNEPAGFIWPILAPLWWSVECPGETGDSIGPHEDKVSSLLCRGFECF